MRLDALRRQRHQIFLAFLWALLAAAMAVGGLLAYAVLALRRPREVFSFFGGPPEPPPPHLLPHDDAALLALVGISVALYLLGLLLRWRLRRRIHALRAPLGVRRRRP